MLTLKGPQHGYPWNVELEQDFADLSNSQFEGVERSERIVLGWLKTLALILFFLIAAGFAGNADREARADQYTVESER